MTFREYLQKKAAEQRQPERRQRREEWIAAVNRLFDQIRTWLAESDPDHLLELIPLEVQRIEPSLGLYNIPSLKVGIGEAAVQIVPVARQAAGYVVPPGEGEKRAEGRVDITDGALKYVLYRTLQDGQESWYVVDEDRRVRPFDRTRLEAILQDLL